MKRFLQPVKNHSLEKEFRAIDNSQLFIISHNDRFLNEVQDGELLFIDYKGKQSGRIEPLCSGCKNLVLNNLSGVVGAIDQLRYVDKIVILEGKSDKTFFEKMLPKYRQFLGNDFPTLHGSHQY